MWGLMWGDLQEELSSPDVRIGKRGGYLRHVYMLNQTEFDRPCDSRPTTVDVEFAVDALAMLQVRATTLRGSSGI